MKIGIVCYPTFGGSGVVATELGYELCQAGHEVHFICYNQPARLTRRCASTIQFHLVDVVSYPLFEFPPYTLALASKIYEVIEQHGLDLVHAHYAIPHSTAAYLAQQMAGTTPVKIITTLHGTDIILIGIDPSYRRVTRFSIEQSNGITAVSHYLADLTQQEFKLTKPLEVIPNFVDPQVFRRRSNPQLRQHFATPDEKIVCHISNFRSLKRVPLIIQMFREIAREVPSRLLLVGNGPDYQACVDLVRREGLLQKVFFLDFVTDVASILSIADLFMLPSEMESFGLAAIEALSCEVPVVASRVGGLPEAVVDGESGYLLPVDDVDGMIGAGISLLSNDELRLRMGREGRRWVMTQFHVSQIVKRYEEYYRYVLEHT
jgi:N-acetyl-alpha-D-glucosaminyl L-malate synthase BshA